MSARGDQVAIRARIVIENPVPGVLHSLQEDDRPLDPKRSHGGAALQFDFPLKVGTAKHGGARLFGKQVRAEGKERQFVYVRIGRAAGDHGSEWTRRMKIDIHDIAPTLLAKAKAGALLVGTIDGTAQDGSPACATIRPVNWSVA